MTPLESTSKKNNEEWMSNLEKANEAQRKKKQKRLQKEQEAFERYEKFFLGLDLEPKETSSTTNEETTNLISKELAVTPINEETEDSSVERELFYQKKLKEHQERREEQRKRRREEQEQTKEKRKKKKHKKEESPNDLKTDRTQDKKNETPQPIHGEVTVFKNLTNFVYHHTTQFAAFSVGMLMVSIFSNLVGVMSSHPAFFNDNKREGALSSNNTENIKDQTSIPMDLIFK